MRRLPRPAEPFEMRYQLVNKIGALDDRFSRPDQVIFRPRHKGGQQYLRSRLLAQNHRGIGLGLRKDGLRPPFKNQQAFAGCRPAFADWRE